MSVLTPDWLYDDPVCTDWTFNELYRSCWITVDELSVYLVRGEDQLTIQLFKRGEEAGPPLAELTQPLSHSATKSLRNEEKEDE